MHSTRSESIAFRAIFVRVTFRFRMCLDRTASRAMFLERTALRAMSSFFTRFLPGIADAVPARATQSATKATIIEGDGR